MSGAISQVVNAFFDNPLPEITTTEQFFREFVKLVAQTVISVVAGFELKDFFYDMDYPDPTDDVVFSFFIMFQSNLLIRYKTVFRYISNSLLTFISTVDTPVPETQ